MILTAQPEQCSCRGLHSQRTVQREQDGLQRNKEEGALALLSIIIPRHPGKLLQQPR